MNLTLVNTLADPAMSASRQSSIVGASVTLLVLSTVVVSLRLVSRWISRAGFWLDDYIIILAMIFSWGPNFINLFSVHQGFGKHVEALPGGNPTLLFKYLYAFEFLYTLGMATVKYSVLSFLHRIFPIVQFRRLLKAILVFLVALTIASVIVSMFQCVPIHAFWDSLGGALAQQLHYQCIDVKKYFIIAGAIGTSLDFILLALPIPILWRLRTGIPQKLLLTGIFTIGCTVCAVSVVRLVLLAHEKQSDITWNYVPESLWTAAEPSTAVICACLPSLRPLFMHILRRNPQSISKLSAKMLASSWREGSGGIDKEESFDRLRQDERTNLGMWGTNSVTVCGGRDVSREEHELGGVQDMEETNSQHHTPKNRIRADTTVVLTISERVEWRNDLF